MKRLGEPGLPFRILILLGFITLLGMGPRPFEADRSLRQARLAQEAGDLLAYSHWTARAAERLSGRADLWEAAGQAALTGGDPESAAFRLGMALAWGEISSTGRLSLGDAFLAVGDFDRAMAIWQKEIASPGAYERLALAHRSRQDYPAAIADLEAKLRLQPGDPQSLYEIGLLLAATQPESASSYLRQAVEGDLELAGRVRMVERALSVANGVEEPAYTALAVGRALAAIGEWELAAEAFRRATLARPDWAEAWAFLGEAQQRLDPGVHTDNLALQYLKKALSLQPASIAANVFMALYWQRHSHQDTALEYMHKAAAAEPDNPVLQAEIGHFLAELGDLPAALQFYERATELAPNDPAFWLILSEFSIRHGIQIRQIALPAARQALILAPADPASHDLMGHTLLLLGDYNNAERFLWQAIRLEPDYALAHLHLGLLSLLQGRSSDAIRQLTLATTLAPETPTAEQARRLLRRYFPFSDGF